MVILTGILLSTTILSVNTPIIEAATKSKEIKVKNELAQPSTIQTTDNAVTSQRKFSDLKDGEELNVAPIFQEDVDKDKSGKEYKDLLQDELGVVDDKGTPLPMTIKKSDDKHGFASEVSYTDDNQTKTFNLIYNYRKTEMTSDIGDPLNFKGGHLPTFFDSMITSGGNLNTPSANISRNSPNGTDLKGNKADVEFIITKSPDIATKGGEVNFTPTKDETYGVVGTPFVRHVKVFEEPDWKQLANRTLQLNDKNGLTKPITITDSNGNKFSVTMNSDAVDITKPGQYKVNYEATGINDDGTPAIDIGNHVVNDPKIVYSKQDQPITVSGDVTKVNYNFLIKDKKSGNVIDTQSGQADDGSTVTVDVSKLPSGYTLSDAQKTFKVDAKNPSKTIEISKNVDYDVKYVDKNTNQQVGKDVTGTGSEGDSIALQAPSDYDFADSSDMIFTLDSSNPQKTVYLVKKATSVVPTQRMNYTIQYKDSDTGKVVSQTTGQSNLGDFVSVNVPSGYSLTDLSSSGFLLTKDNMTFTSYVTKANTAYNISYVDESTDKEVGTQSGTGTVDSVTDLKVPTGYALINADDATYQIKNDNNNVKILVRKTNDNDDLGLVATYPTSGAVKVYDIKGEFLNVELAQASNWVTDQLKTINGLQYYRVATNKYIRTNTVYKYVPFSDVVITSKETPVYDSKGKVNAEKVLAKNTSWYTDRIAKINGTKMYRVATDMWVKADDIQLLKTK